MAAKKKQSAKLSGTQKVSLGVGITAAAAAAAGAYFLYGSDKASSNRKTVKSWALKAKAEVLESLENVEHITEAEYRSIVEAVSGTYGVVKDATKGELKDFKKEMVDHWHSIEQSGVAQDIVSAATKVVKKPAKKATKKVSKKATKKTAKQATKKVAKKATKKATKKSA